MCRTAGRRCSNHPRRKYMKYAADANKLSAQAEEVLLAMNAIEMKSPNDYLEDDEYKKLKTKREGLLKEIDTVEAKRDEELANYYTTPAGQEYLKNVTEDDKTSLLDKYNAYSEQIAGAERRINQNQLGKLLSDQSLSPETRIAIARNEITKSKRSIKRAEKRISEIKRSAISLQQLINDAEENNDQENLAIYKKRLADMLVEMNYLEKGVAQKKGRVKDLEGWLGRFVSNAFDGAIDKLFDFNNILIDAAIKPFDRPIR